MPNVLERDIPPYCDASHSFRLVDNYEAWYLQSGACETGSENMTK
jgi:hypothetical protein